MDSTEAYKWNQRYKSDPERWLVEARPLLKNYAHILPSSGWALDIAMGAGSNANFLAQQGLKVLGIDISIEALSLAKQRNPDLRTVAGDVNFLPMVLPPIDVISNFYFLQRELIKKFIQILKPGGLVFIETLTLDMIEIRPDILPEFLLKPNELPQMFTDWDVVYYREGWTDSVHGYRKATASLIARSPLSN
jgi:SAM-dependent methyltransferase